MTSGAGRPGLRSAFSIHALGLAIGLTVEDPELGPALGLLLSDLAAPPGAVEEPAPERRVDVRGTGPWDVESVQHAGRATTIEQAVSHACAAVNLTATSGTPLLAYHCAVVTRGDRTLAVPGRSGLGKTTVAAGLMLRGWEYVSDEALAFDWETGALHGYPRPMGLSPWSMSALGITGGVPGDGETLLRAVDLGSRTTVRPPAVSDVLIMERRPGGLDLRLDGAHRQDALAALVPRGLHPEPGRRTGPVGAHRDPATRPGSPPQRGRAG